MQYAEDPAERVPSFDDVLAAHGLAPLRRRTPTTLQVNVGKRCNQACHHCHVDAGPKRTERMTAATAERVLDVLAASPDIEVVDITGGAPELNESFRTLVKGARALGRRVMDRCNLTVLLEPGQEDTAALLAEHRVEIVASLPCYTRENVEKQRGNGVFAASIEALLQLNALGYGVADSGLDLALVYNPGGAYLPGAQAGLEADYRARLGEEHGVVFNRLYTIANMPIARFAHDLARSGRTAEYMGLLVNHFNPVAANNVMCRDLVSVGWDGLLYDCDFNQMLEISLGGTARTIFDVDDLSALGGDAIATAPHCLGCTAGSGSSCGGALA